MEKENNTKVLSSPILSLLFTLTILLLSILQLQTDWYSLTNQNTVLLSSYTITFYLYGYNTTSSTTYTNTTEMIYWNTAENDLESFKIFYDVVLALVIALIALSSVVLIVSILRIVSMRMFDYGKAFNVSLIAVNGFLMLTAVVLTVGYWIVMPLVFKADNFQCEGTVSACDAVMYGHRDDFSNGFWGPGIAYVMSVVNTGFAITSFILTFSMSGGGHRANVVYFSAL